MEEEDLCARIKLCLPVTYSSTNLKQITTNPNLSRYEKILKINSLSIAQPSDYLVSTDFQWNDRKAHTIMLISF